MLLAPPKRLLGGSGSVGKDTFGDTNGVMVKEGWGVAAPAEAVLEAESGRRGWRLSIGGCEVGDVSINSDGGNGA